MLETDLQKQVLRVFIYCTGPKVPIGEETPLEQTENTKYISDAVLSLMDPQTHVTVSKGNETS